MGLELTSVVKHMELVARLLEGGAEHGPCAGTADIPTVSQSPPPQTAQLLWWTAGIGRRSGTPSPRHF